MRKSAKATLTLLCASAFVAGCSSTASEELSLHGTLYFTAHSMCEVEVLYSGMKKTEDRFALLISNLDYLESPSTDYCFYGWEGAWSEHDYDIDKVVFPLMTLTINCQIYDESLSPLYEIYSNFYCTTWITDIDHSNFTNFEGLIEYTLIEDEVDEDANTISYQSNTPDEYVLEFIGADGVDIHDYTAQIEEQVDILSRNYVIMDSGVTRYVSISDSSEEEVEA